VLKTTLFVIFFSSFAFAQNHEFSNPNVRVKLKSGLSALTLEGIGPKGTGKLLVQRVQKNNSWVWQIGASRLQSEKILHFEGTNLHHGSMLLPNTVILLGRKNSFDVIGILPLEDYLVGVLASEMPLSWPIETLKAQAIAARSYSLVRIKERSRDYFDMESTVADQVFAHIRSGPDNNPLIQKAKSAVFETSGMVLVSPLTSKVIKAFYHSNCGGKTQDAKLIWGVGPSTGVAQDSYCELNPKAHWSLKVEVQKVAEKLRSYFKAPGLPNLESLSLSKAGLLNVEALWSNHQKKSLAAQDMRAVLGYDKLRSTSFSVQKVGESFIFQGRGFGHGVGLCQWGAKAMGKAGAKFDQIIRHYYPKADIQFTSALRLALRKQKSPLLQRSAEESNHFSNIK
jgi:stage II sporulation protein D